MKGIFIHRCTCTDQWWIIVVVFLCVFTSHQQPRTHGDEAMAYSIIRKTGEAGDRTYDRFVYKANRWFILCAARSHGAWNACRLTETAVIPYQE